MIPESGGSPRITTEYLAETCWEMYCNLTGDQTSPDWNRLTVAQREVWRRIVDFVRDPEA